VPSSLTWDVFQIFVDILSPIVNAFVFNQSCGHWLFYNMLHAITTMALKLKEEFGMAPFMAIWWKMIWFGFKVVYVCFQYHKTCDCWDGFLLSQKKFEEKKACIMLFLMLDQIFKSLRLVSSFIGWKQVVLWWKIMIDGFFFQCYWNVTMYFTLC
jgi:hypothetical protein